MIVTICITVSFCYKPVYAKVGEGHDADLEAVLFGDRVTTSDMKTTIKMLEAASYLTIDQFQSNGQAKLDLLSRNGVKGLPKLEDINIDPGAANHRKYAHNGWNSEWHQLKYNSQYSKDEKWQKKWKKRKGILLDTVNEIFGFSWFSNIPLIGSALNDYGEDCDSFCALVYYTHILGDHEVTDDISQYEVLLPIGGGPLDNSIIQELTYHCETLFSDQERTEAYKSLMDGLDELNDEWLEMGDVNKDKIKKNQEIATKLLKLMEENVPELLENTDFFADVFYKNKVA